MNPTNINLKIGIARENYAYNIFRFRNKWNVYRSNDILNKYKNIDLICFDSKKQKYFVQVKGISFYNLIKQKSNKIATIQKTLNYAIKHDAILLYAFVELNGKKLFFTKRINYEEQWWC